MKKILFTKRANAEDYLADTLLDGLRQLDDLEVTDAPKIWYMYRNEFVPYGPHTLESRYGKGFTTRGILEDIPSIDRSNIEEKIKNHYFDLIICARTDHEQLTPYINLILEHYKEHEIIALDGQDRTYIEQRLIKNSTHFVREILGEPVDGFYPGGSSPHGWSWQPYHVDDVYPVSFAFPDKKIQTPLPKTRPWSIVLPEGNHLHRVEQDYYNDYRQSLFGRTRMKSGWDAMRHYEIMACRCIPYFQDLADCPRNTLTTLPKELLLHVKQRVDEKGAEFFMPGNEGWNEYQELEQKIFDHFLENCTTSKLAKYVLNTHQQRISNS
jgi:hypothetical protein